MVVCLVTIITSCKKNMPDNQQALIPGSVPYVQASGLYIPGIVPVVDSINDAAVWKDGSIFSLSNKNSTCNAMTIVGNDVYIVGWCGSDMVYWKNSVISTPLYSPGGILAKDVTGIAVMGNDVYVSGLIVQKSDNREYPVYWKNGNLVYLKSDPGYLTGSGTRGIAVSGNDVYILGDWAGNAIYWKNEVVNVLPNNSRFAYSITTSGNDVYILGKVDDPNVKFNQLAAYWKNGVITYLNTNIYYPMQIAVKGNDVYVCGNLLGVHWYGVYLKNNILTNLGKDSGTVASYICVDNNNNVYLAGTVLNISGSAVPLIGKMAFQQY